MGRLAVVAGLLAFVVGVGSLALTLYLWLGDWPESARETLEHFRSVGETQGRPPAPLIANVRGRSPRSLGGTWNALIEPVGLGAMQKLNSDPLDGTGARGRA